MVGEDPFQSLLLQVASEHAKQVQELQAENEKLKYDLLRLRSSSPCAAEHNTYPEQQTSSLATGSNWMRLILGMRQGEEAYLKLEVVRHQRNPSKLCEDAKRACIEAQRFLSSQITLQAAIGAYDMLYLSSIQEKSKAWKDACVALRKNILVKCWCRIGSECFADFEQVLAKEYGAERFSTTGDLTLRSQLLKTFDHLFPGQRVPARPKKKRPKRSAHGQVDSSEMLAKCNDPCGRIEVRKAIVASTVNTFICVNEVASHASKDSLESWPQEQKKQYKKQIKFGQILHQLSVGAMTLGQAHAKATSLKRLANQHSFLVNLQDLISAIRRHFEDQNVVILLLDSFPTEFQEDHSSMIEVVSMLADVLQRHALEHEVQVSALRALRRVFRQQSLVFGLYCDGEIAQQVLSLDLDLRSRLESCLTQALSSPNLQKFAIQSAARSQSMEVVMRMAKTAAMQETMLSEVYYSLEAPLRAFSRDEGSSSHVSLLQKLAQQRPLMPCTYMDAIAWFKEIHWADQIKPRMLLKGVLLGCKNGLIRSLDVAIQSSPMDENMLAATFRAISEMHEYFSPLPPWERDAINDCAIRIGHSAHKLQAYARSAMVGALGSLNRGCGAEIAASLNVPHLGVVLELMLGLGEELFDYWHVEASFYHELLWSFQEIFKGSCGLGDFERPVCRIAQDLVGKWRKEADRNPNKVQFDDDYAKIMEIASALMSMGSPELMP